MKSLLIANFTKLVTVAYFGVSMIFLLSSFVAYIYINVLICTGYNFRNICSCADIYIFYTTVD